MSLIEPNQGQFSPKLKKMKLDQTIQVGPRDNLRPDWVNTSDTLEMKDLKNLQGFTFVYLDIVNMTSKD